MKNSYLQQWRGCNCLVTICVILNYTRQPSKLQNYKKGWMFVSGWKWCKSKDVLIILPRCPVHYQCLWKKTWTIVCEKTIVCEIFIFFKQTYISLEISQNVLSKNNFYFSLWNKFKVNNKDPRTTSDIVLAVLLG